MSSSVGPPVGLVRHSTEPDREPRSALVALCAGRVTLSISFSAHPLAPALRKSVTGTPADAVYPTEEPGHPRAQRPTTTEDHASAAKHHAPGLDPPELRMMITPASCLVRCVRRMPRHRRSGRKR